MQVLLTFVGFHDPSYPSRVDGEELKGPILYLLGIRRFDRVYLFSAANTMAIARRTAAAVGETMPGTEAHIVPVDIDDPIDYIAIMAAVRSAFGRISSECQDARYAISTASGTPQMHASWLLLASTGEIPAVILQTRPPQFVTTDRPAVEEVDLNAVAPREHARKPVEAAAVLPRVTGPLLEDLALDELGIVGRHPSFREALARAAQFARSPLPVLIQGETGTGKELVARYIHRLSGLPAEALQVVNCAAVPRELAESLLFGHRKGAFTGAVADERGAFERADGGTLFLDEIGELHLEVQATLLRVLEDGIVQPLGASAGKRVRVRLIAATNKDLRSLLAEKRFREDLYYRIEVGTVRLPPLRERRSDIPLLAMAGLENANSRLSRPKRWSPAALDRLMSLEWPGNIRSLMNVVERTVQLTRGELIDEGDLQVSDDRGALSGDLPEPSLGFDVQAFLDKARSRLFERALEKSAGNASAAARLLNVTPQAVSKFLKK
ncbi:MAG: RNA repair transcriptional activator RtcR family protein [Spirochaetia bacterium]